MLSLNNEKFEEQLKMELLSVSYFESFYVAVSPLKQKIVRNNNQPFMRNLFIKLLRRDLNEQISVNKDRNIENRWQQSDYSSNLLKQSKKHRFKDVTKHLTKSQN